jgi:hypothetical protein
LRTTENESTARTSDVDPIEGDKKRIGGRNPSTNPQRFLIKQIFQSDIKPLGAIPQGLN